MPESKFIQLSTESGDPAALAKAEARASLLRQMEDCLLALDREGAAVAAAHLATAIDQARIAFKLAVNISETE